MDNVTYSLRASAGTPLRFPCSLTSDSLVFLRGFHTRVKGCLPVGFSRLYGAAGVVFDDAVEKPFTHYVGCCVFFATIGFSYCPGECECNMKTFTRKVATTAIAAIILTGVVGAPPAQAQELTSKEGCWNGMWSNTGEPVVERLVKVIDRDTGLPHPTAEAFVEWVKVGFDFYPAMSSYIGGGTIYCGW